MTRVLAAIGVFALAMMVGAAPPQSQPAVELLISQLGSERFAEREAAGKALEAIGPAAVPALIAAAQSQNPEVVRRATEVLGRLRRGAESDTRLKPKTVRLAYKNLPLGTAVHDLKARTGIDLVLDPANVADPLRLVTCETGDLPVWQAVEAFCKAAGVREVFAADLPIPKSEARRRVYYSPPPTPTSDTIPVTLADGTYVSHPGSRTTAVRVLLLPQTFPGHRVTLGTGEVTLCFDVTPVPGLNWQDVAGVRVTKLIDDTGRYGSGGSIKEPDPNPFDPFGGQIFINRGGRVVMFRADVDGNMIQPTTQPNPRVVQVPVKIANPAARSLKRLEGVVLGEILVPGQPLLTVVDPATHIGATFGIAGGTRLTVADVRSTGAGSTNIRLQLEGPSAWQSARRRNVMAAFMPEAPQTPDMSPQVKAYDAANRPIAATVSSYAPANDDGETMTTSIQLTFPGGPPAKIVVVGPKPTIVEIPFEMENVPLP